MKQTQRREKTERLLLVLLLLIALLSMAVAVWALFFRDVSVLIPDYDPQQQEQNAQKIPDDSGEKLEQPEGGGSVSLTYSGEVTVDLSDRAASLYFANPGKSNLDMILQIVVQDTVILQTGTLAPGNRVKLVELLPGAERLLAPGGYEGKFVVLFYEAASGEQSIVNAEIPVTIQVVG